MSLAIGKINTLNVTRFVDFGAYLDGFEYGEILLPAKYLNPNIKTGSPIRVFVYYDSEDRLIATTETPLAMVGEISMLTAIMITPVGAFLDWGLPKDLLVPFREQKHKMHKGRQYLVYIYIDEVSERIVASSKIEKFLHSPPASFRPNDPIEALIYEKTEIGFKVIINNKYPGILYTNDIFKDVRRGQTFSAFIKKIRNDGKIDITLNQPGYKKVIDSTHVILAALRENRGYIAVNDKTDPKQIYETFGISKKTFKKAIGSLYKNKQITISKDGIKLI
jgi:predicted RNA-binding protein (virulence factor B family)